MSEGNVAAIVLAIIGVFAVPGFWQWMKSKSEKPLMKKQVEQGDQHNADQTALAISKEAREDAAAARAHAEWLASRLERVSSELTAEREQRVLGQEQQGRQLNRLERILQAWDDWWADLDLNWAMHRQRDKAPPKPTTDLSGEG
jgi:hypothetical protein